MTKSLFSVSGTEYSYAIYGLVGRYYPFFLWHIQRVFSWIKVINHYFLYLAVFRSYVTYSFIGSVTQKESWLLIVEDLFFPPSRYHASELYWKLVSDLYVLMLI